MDNGLQTVEDRAIDCNDEPNSMNGAKYPKGCAGAVWSDGTYSEDYCNNTGYAKGRFPWWGKCCRTLIEIDGRSRLRCVSKAHFA